MDPLGITIGIFIAGTLIVLAAYFAWRQQMTMAVLRFDAKLSHEQRRYLVKQCQRRFFGCFLLILLSGMLIGSLFLDFDPLRLRQDDVPQVDREIARQAVRFLTYYVMAMLLVLMLILAVAFVDFWATARYSFQQQKRLLQEHHDLLQAELMELRHRRSEMN